MDTASIDYYRDNGYYYTLLGLYRDNGKENGNYYGFLSPATRFEGFRVKGLGFRGLGLKVWVPGLGLEALQWGQRLLSGGSLQKAHLILGC